MGRLTAAVERRDPECRSLKRAVRGAVVVSVAFALGQATGRPQVAVFALFGSFALTLLVDFVAEPARRRRAYLGLVAVGCLLVVLGTLCSRSALLGASVMAVVGFLVLFGSLANPLLVQGTPATLLMFVLPVCLPAAPSAIGQRLAGLAIAAVLAVPAVLLVWPTPHRARLRQALAHTAGALAALAASHAAGNGDPEAAAQAGTSWDRLLQVLEGTAYPPAGAAPGDEALLALVSQLGQVKRELLLAEGTAPEVLKSHEVAGLNAEAAAVLDRAARLLVSPDKTGAAELDRALGALRADRERSIAAEVARLSRDAGRWSAGAGAAADKGAGYLVDVVDPTFRARSLSVALEVAARSVLAAVPAADADRAGSASGVS